MKTESFQFIEALVPKIHGAAKGGDDSLHAQPRIFISKE